jgi:CRP-like cAMP-binding protein
MEQIRLYFEHKFGINANDWAIFSSKLSEVSMPKKHLVLKLGQIEEFLYFIEKGILRFYIPKDENDITFGFAFENRFTSGYSSFITREPSVYQIETLTPSILWRVSFNDLQFIYDNTEIGNTIGRKASEELFMEKSKREISLLNESPETRYLNLFIEQPQLIKQIPLKYIASYIGVTPQALSRIRRRIS